MRHSAEFAVCPEGHFTLTSPCSIDFLRAIVPLSIITIFLLFTLPCPAIVSRIFSPFRPMFVDPCSYEELAPAEVKAQVSRVKAAGKAQGLQAWKYTILVMVPLLEVVGWWGLMGWSVSADVLARREVGSGKQVWMVWMSALIGLSWLYITITHVLLPSTRPPYKTFALTICHFLFSIISLGSLAFLHSVYGEWPASATKARVILEFANFAGCAMLLIVTLTMRMSDPEFVKRMPVAPEDDITLFQWLTFSWVTPIVTLGSSRDLEEKDIPSLSLTQDTANCFEKFKQTPGKSVLHRLLRINALDITVDASLTFISAALIYVPPFLIKKILEAIADPTPEAISRAYIYAILSFLSSCLKAEVDVFHLWAARRASVRIYGQLVTLIYEKALKRKDASGVSDTKSGEEEKGTSAKGKAGTQSGGEDQSKKDKKSDKKAKDDIKKASDAGKVVNMMSGDVSRIQNTISGAYFIYGPLVEIPVALAFLYSLLGWSAAVGFLVMIASMPMTSGLMARSTVIQRELLKRKDKRINLITEVMGALKFIKFAGWVERFQGKIREARQSELDQSKKSLGINTLFNMVWGLAPVFVNLISFGCYIFVAKNSQFTAAIAFTAISLFNQLRGPLGSLPAFAVMVNQSYVALGRIDDFLSEPEVPDWVSSLKRPTNMDHKEGQPVAAFRNASLDWYTGDFKIDPTEGPQPVKLADDSASSSDGGNVIFRLSDIDLEFPDSKLSVIVGPTGGGKSALLNALIGEMDLESGEVVLCKDPTFIDAATGLRNAISICTQVPFLQTMSIRDNILFNEEFDEERYEAVLEACALTTDLNILEDGDQTEVGQRGISMSGGQKSRIALARAVYARNRCVIMDDVLSALDSQTGRYIYENCLKGPLMKGRTVILVTHHLDLVLPGTDYLVRLIDGRVDCAGPPEELRAQGKLEGLVALEKAEVKTEELAVNLDEIEQEEEAVETGSKTAKPASEGKKLARQLISKEEQATGSVSFSVYTLYLKAAGWPVWLAIFAILGLTQLASLGERFWIKIWSGAYRQADHFVGAYFLSAMHMNEHGSQDHFHTASIQAMHHVSNTTAALAPAETQPGSNWPNANDRPLFYISIFALVLLSEVFLTTVLGAASWLSGYLAGRNIHERMLQAVTRATFRWHDRNPSGRIISRFSKDVETLDSSISFSLRLVLFQVATVIATFVTVAAIVPQFIVPCGILFYFYYRLTNQYLKVTRDLRRYESTRRSPIYSGFSELLDGIVVVRAFGMDRVFLNKITTQVAHSQAPFYYLWMVNRWLLLRFDCLGAGVVFSATVFCLYAGVDGGLAGVAITCASALTSSLYWISRFAGGLQQDANAIERANEYLHLPQEQPAIIPSSRPPAYWPSNHSEAFLRVENLTVKYAPDLPAVLKGVSFVCKPKEKIGIIGRTGSGKSSLAMALLRFVDPDEGKIILDGIDVTSIGVDDLRSKITYINQEATIFSGTVKENLDPFNEHSEEELVQILERVNLGQKNGVSAGPSRVPSTMNLGASPGDGTETPATVVAKKASITLDTSVSANGSNFSAGQRQLLALARALLRSSSLIIADEATSSIDFETDNLIQEAIRTDFKESCTITIAHRLTTVADMDKILVLADGGVAEFDSPWELLKNESSVFHQMCEHSGKFQQLKDIAEQTAKAKGRA